MEGNARLRLGSWPRGLPPNLEPPPDPSFAKLRRDFESLVREILERG
jgi:hypothetical protein